MAAKDYDIHCGWKSAYITKRKKKENGEMSQDRREITDSEIMMLIDFTLCHFLDEKNKKEGGFAYPSHIKDGYQIELRLTPIKKEDE